MSDEKLQAENARLKTEVEHLMVFCNCTLIPNKELQAENARLKAEVERLEDFCTRTIIPNEILQSENESLRKGGDAMAALIKYEPGVNTFDPIPQVVKKWNAAKESKPSV